MILSSMLTLDVDKFLFLVSMCVLREIAKSSKMIWYRFGDEGVLRAAKYVSRTFCVCDMPHRCAETGVLPACFYTLPLFLCFCRGMFCIRIMGGVTCCVTYMQSR